MFIIHHINIICIRKIFAARKEQEVETAVFRKPNIMRCVHLVYLLNFKIEKNGTNNALMQSYNALPILKYFLSHLLSMCLKKNPLHLLHFE